jgi:hypothetical protein
MNTRRTLASLAVAALVAAFGPFTLNTSQAGPLVRLSGACAQATECITQLNRICSTFHNDYKDYACSKGCPKAVVEEPAELALIES